MPHPIRGPVRTFFITALVLGAALPAAGQPPSPTPTPLDGSSPGTEELSRGPVHEAFAQPVVFDPQPGPVVPKAPPAPVNEVPPDEKPVGDDVVWIPGYWAWDNDANQFVWVSGFWRKLPPGRTWVPGYWTTTTGGSQWVSGYWGADAAAENQYLPEPPQSLEAGPVGAAPGPDQVWMPGTWVWRDTQYAWQPGYWMTGSPDWVWMPATYSWSPLGYCYHAGYWDYPLWTRGVPFAPVAFANLGAGPYTPRLALNATYLPYALFAHPRTGSYYFGDYYAATDLKAGYYPWFSFHNTRYGFDPLFAHADWVYGRQNINWEARLRDVYYDRRDHPAERPARLYRDYARGAVDRGDIALVRPLGELRTARDVPFKMERVAPARLRDVEQHARAVRDFGAERARVEAARAREAGPPVAARKPVSLRLPDPPRGAAVAGRSPTSPVYPPVDPARKPEFRPATPAPVERPHPLPHPTDVIHPTFDRRAVPKAAVEHPPVPPAVKPAPVPPVRPNPPTPPVALPHPAVPPVVRPAPPPINGLPHPAHVAAAVHPAPPPVAPRGKH